LKVALLAGGTGGAKLAAGMQQQLGDELSVIVNTADDLEILGVYVSPDPDLVSYWLSGEIDEQRGWGIRDDGFTVFDRMVQLGAPDWFRLSDRDLAACLYRRHFLDEGGRLTDAQAQLTRALGVRAAVLPMCEQPVRTRVGTADGWRELQQYLVAERAEPEIEAIELAGIEAARPTPEVTAALSAADAIVIGPSNPVISIGPILAVTGIRDAIASAPAPVVAVSPFVGGRAVKGPTDDFCRSAGIELSAQGVADAYRDVLDAIVADEQVDGIPALVTDTLMSDAADRRELARKILDFAGSAPSRGSG
jgi:LPPG:FO 2-phospho-L-lactate transferase